MWDHLCDHHLYIDANIFIEAFEGFSPQAAELKRLFGLIEAGSVLATTSEWTYAEIIVRPMAMGHKSRMAEYQAILSGHGAIKTEPVSRAILTAAAAYCAAHKMPLPDCVHVATAMQTGCDLFLTRDRGILLPSHLERVFPGD